MRRKLGACLLDAGVIDQAGLDAALALQARRGGRLGEILVSEAMVDEEQVAAALSEQLGLARVRLDQAAVDPRLARLVPVEMAESGAFVPLSLEGEGGGTLIVATSDPTDLAVLDQVQFRTGKRVEAVVATASEVRDAIRAVYGEGRGPGAAGGPVGRAPKAGVRHRPDPAGEGGWRASAGGGGPGGPGAEERDLLAALDALAAGEPIPPTEAVRLRTDRLLAALVAALIRRGAISQEDVERILDRR